jgi:integrase/recombinase XerD
MNELEQAVADFLADKRANARSLRTAEHYQTVLGRVFLPWCQVEKLAEPARLTKPTLDRFKVYLREKRNGDDKPLAQASQKSYLTAVHGFLVWTGEQGLTTPGVNVKPIGQLDRKVLNTLSRAEIGEMEAAANSERDKLIIRILGDSGIRLGELLGLKPESLTTQGRENYLTVHGKGGKDRLVPILPAVATRFKRYAEKGRPAEDYSGKVFIVLRKRASGGYDGLRARAVQTMLKEVAHKAGIKKRVNPHSFRHSAATNALRLGANPISLAENLGHSDLKMLQRTYSHLVASDRHAEMMRLLANDS